jgi:hypothetical protein
MCNKETIVTVLQRYGYGVLDACPIADNILKDFASFDGKKKAYHIQIRPLPAVTIEISRK